MKVEFFRQFECNINPVDLQALLTLERLPVFCASIDRLLEHNGESGQIYCLWGSFKVNREPIRHGVRFSLPGCPNALAWSITTEQASLTIHCTINRTYHEPEFIESIDQFVDDWQAGLQQSLNENN